MAVSLSKLHKNFTGKLNNVYVPNLLVVIPYWHSQESIKASVQSILKQSYKDFVLLVINDGDNSSHEVLNMIKDHRLHIFDMQRNHGRYFCDQVALTANPYPYYAIQDSDDISDRKRLELMMNKMSATASEACFSDQFIKLFTRSYTEKGDKLFEPLTPEMRHLAHQAGVYKTDALRGIGGFRPDFRVGYDTLMTNLFLMAYTVSYVDKPLYTRIKRVNSLTSSKDTGMKSFYRAQQVRRLNALYKRTIYSDQRPRTIRHLVTANISPSITMEVDREALKLKRFMKW